MRQREFSPIQESEAVLTPGFPSCPARAHLSADFTRLQLTAPKSTRMLQVDGLVGIRAGFATHVRVRLSSTLSRDVCWLELETVELGIETAIPN